MLQLSRQLVRRDWVTCHTTINIALLLLTSSKTNWKDGAATQVYPLRHWPTNPSWSAVVPYMWRVQQGTRFTREAKVLHFCSTPIVQNLWKNITVVHFSGTLCLCGLSYISSRSSQRRAVLGILLIDARNLTFHWDVTASPIAPPSSRVPQSPSACWADVLSPFTLLVMRCQYGRRQRLMSF